MTRRQFAIESARVGDLSHAFEPVAVAAFKVRDGCLDNVILAEAFKGDARRGASFGARLDKVYLEMAEHVLECMEAAGKIRRDGMGWCYLVEDR